MENNKTEATQVTSLKMKNRQASFNIYLVSMLTKNHEFSIFKPKLRAAQDKD